MAIKEKLIINMWFTDYILKKMSRTTFQKDGHHTTDAFRTYASPLIKGED